MCDRRPSRASRDSRAAPRLRPGNSLKRPKMGCCDHVFTCRSLQGQPISARKESIFNRETDKPSTHEHWSPVSSEGVVHPYCLCCAGMCKRQGPWCGDVHCHLRLSTLSPAEYGPVGGPYTANGRVHLTACVRVRGKGLLQV